MIIISPLHFDYNLIGTGKTFTEKFGKILEHNKLEYKYLRFQNSVEFWEEINKSKLFIARYRGIEKDLALMHAILPEIERKNIPTLPNYKTAYHCGDKLRLAAFYQSNGINHPETKIYWEFDELVQGIDNLEFPLIAKLRKGAGSTNVIKVNSKEQILRLGSKLLKKGVRSGMLEEAAYGKLYILHILNRLIFHPNLSNFKTLKRKIKYLLYSSNDYDNSCLILQEFLPENKYDTRITVIGDRAFGFRRFNRSDDFRASGSGLIDYNPNKIDSNMINTAFEISQKFGFQTMAYDFVYDKYGQPSILEHNFTYVDSAVAKCPVYWKPNSETVKNNNIYPQYWQLVDALNDTTLKYNYQL